MLVLSRKAEESMFIGDDIKITVLDIRGGQVRIGITAPQEIKIHREEVYERLAKDFGLTQEKISQRMGKSRESVANAMRLLKLPRQIKEDLISGRLTMGHGRALLGLKNEKDIEILRRKIVGQSLNVRETEAQVHHTHRNTESSVRKKAKKDIFIRKLEMELERKLGTKVEIALGKKGGKVVIKYYSDDDLERIRTFFV